MKEILLTPIVLNGRIVAIDSPIVKDNKGRPVTYQSVLINQSGAPDGETISVQFKNELTAQLHGLSQSDIVSVSFVIRSNKGFHNLHGLTIIKSNNTHESYTNQRNQSN